MDLPREIAERDALIIKEMKGMGLKKNVVL